MDNMDILTGARIKNLRMGLRLSQEDVVLLLKKSGVNVNQATFSKWERGASPMRFRDAVRLSEVLGVTVDALNGQQSSPPPIAAAVDITRGIDMSIAALQRLRERHEDLLG